MILSSPTTYCIVEYRADCHPLCHSTEDGWPRVWTETLSYSEALNLRRLAADSKFFRATSSWAIEQSLFCTNTCNLCLTRQGFIDRCLYGKEF